MDTNELLYSILTLMPEKSGTAGQSAEQRTLEIIASMVAGVPNSINLPQLKIKTGVSTGKNDNPMTVVLVQEV